jgi:hypothetical protein
MIKRAIAAGLALTMAGGCLAAAETRKPAGKQARAAAPANEALPCPRATYRNDPVCFGDDDAGNLPTPSHKAERQAASPGFRVNDEVSIRPSTDVKSSDKTPVRFNNANPNPHSQDVSGGAAVHYKF